jgi:hypothetical protein
MQNERKTPQNEVTKTLPRWLPLVTEIWLLGLIVAFLMIRVLGSNPQPAGSR